MLLVENRNILFEKEFQKTGYSNNITPAALIEKQT